MKSWFGAPIRICIGMCYLFVSAFFISPQNLFAQEGNPRSQARKIVELEKEAASSFAAQLVLTDFKQVFDSIGRDIFKIVASQNSFKSEQRILSELSMLQDRMTILQTESNIPAIENQLNELSKSIDIISKKIFILGWKVTDITAISEMSFESFAVLTSKMKYLCTSGRSDSLYQTGVPLQAPTPAGILSFHLFWGTGAGVSANGEIDPMGKWEAKSTREIQVHSLAASSVLSGVAMAAPAGTALATIAVAAWPAFLAIGVAAFLINDNFVRTEKRKTVSEMLDAQTHEWLHRPTDSYVKQKYVEHCNALVEPLNQIKSIFLAARDRKSKNWQDHLAEARSNNNALFKYQNAKEQISLAYCRAVINSLYNEDRCNKDSKFCSVEGNTVFALDKSCSIKIKDVDTVKKDSLAIKGFESKYTQAYVAKLMKYQIIILLNSFDTEDFFLSIRNQFEAIHSRLTLTDRYVDNLKVLTSKYNLMEQYPSCIHDKMQFKNYILKLTSNISRLRSESEVILDSKMQSTSEECLLASSIKSYPSLTTTQ